MAATTPLEATDQSTASRLGARGRRPTGDVQPTEVAHHVGDEVDVAGVVEDARPSRRGRAGRCTMFGTIWPATTLRFDGQRPLATGRVDGDERVADGLDRGDVSRTATDARSPGCPRRRSSGSVSGVWATRAIRRAERRRGCRALGRRHGDVAWPVAPSAKQPMTSTTTWVRARVVVDADLAVVADAGEDHVRHGLAGHHVDARRQRRAVAGRATR